MRFSTDFVWHYLFHITELCVSIIQRRSILTHKRQLVNLVCLRLKTEVCRVLIREMLFADDAALTIDTEQNLRQLISQLKYAYKKFKLSINIKKTNIMNHDFSASPTISINDMVLEDTDYFWPLPSPTIYQLTWKTNKRIAKFSKKLWDNSHQKLKVFQTHVSFAAGKPYIKEENHYLCCLRYILSITWSDKVSNTAMLEKADSGNMHLLLWRNHGWVMYMK